ncbi:MAG: helix-turn-helix domain-containing protein [Vulcanimicrobiaceae bacterium]
MSVTLYSATELLKLVGSRARERRLAYGLRQVDLAEAAGVTLPTVRRFENGANVGFEAIVQIALALGAEHEIAQLFSRPETRTLEQILDAGHRRSRARKRS